MQEGAHLGGQRVALVGAVSFALLAGRWETEAIADAREIRDIVVDPRDWRVAYVATDVGVEARVEKGPIEAAAALTTGTLSNPRVGDDNAGRQLSARVAWRPFVGAIVGVSAAHGEWLAGNIKNRLSMALQDRSYPQTAYGLDAEYSRGYFLARGEMIAGLSAILLASNAGSVGKEHIAVMCTMSAQAT